MERKLSAENRKLFVSVEKELNENKRLSMENEELQWRIRQSSMSEAAGLSMSAIEGKGCTKLVNVC